MNYLSINKKEEYLFKKIVMKIDRKQLENLIREEAKRLHQKTLLENRLSEIEEALSDIDEGKKNKPKNVIDKEDIHKINVSKTREDQKQAGMFDGRFRTRSEKDKTKYTRTQKHRGKGWD